MKAAMIFPGQGSQSVGMARDLYESFPKVAELYREADEILGFSLSRVSFQGDAEFLTETRNAQPAILLHSIAVSRVLQDEGGVEPAIVAGHSLGEYSSLVAAGVIGEMDALRIVRKRGELMFEEGKRHPGTMAAVIGLDRDQIELVCNESSGEQIVVVANINSPGQTVISGHIDAVERAMKLAEERGARKTVRLSVSGAFHSPLVAEAQEELIDYLNNFDFYDARVDVICNADAQPIRKKEAIIDALSRQLTSPVLWSDSMRVLLSKWDGPVMEVGPGRVLTGLLKRIDRGREMRAVGTAEELGVFAQSETDLV